MTDVTDVTGARLREAFSRVAPEGYPTIGVREAIVDAVRARRHHKQRVAWSLAACCVLIVGASVAATRLDVGKSRSNFSAGPQASANSPRVPVLEPQKAAASSAAAAAARCAVISSGSGSPYTCSGVFSTPAAVDYSFATGTEPAAPSLYDKSNTTAGGNGAGGITGGQPGGATASQGQASEQDQPLNGPQELVVPVDRPVTITLPGIPGEIWTSPAVQTGQGQGAAGVRTVSARAGIPGNGSTATFESGAPVTVVVVASGLAVCGPLQAACGTPDRIWTVVLEFRKS